MGALDGEITGRQMADRAGDGRAGRSGPNLRTLRAGVAEVRSAGGVLVGTVERRRHQSMRTYATGWRWFPFGPTGQGFGPRHGFETRRAAVDYLTKASGY